MAESKEKGDEVAGARAHRGDVNRSATCVLVARARPDEAPRRHRIGAGEAVLGSSGTVKIDAKGAQPEHARVEHVGGAWTVQPIRGAVVRVNGVRARHPVSLETGDRIGIGEGMAIFCPDIPDVNGLGPAANGFSRARHHHLTKALGSWGATTRISWRSWPSSRTRSTTASAGRSSSRASS